MEKLKSLLQENDRLRSLIPVQFRPVMTSALDKVDLAFRPGLITVCWTSLGVDSYFSAVDAALQELSQFIKTVADIKEMRIDAPLASIGDSMLVIVPEEESGWTPAEFFQKTKQHCEQIAFKLDTESRKVPDSLCCAMISIAL